MNLDLPRILVVTPTLGDSPFLGETMDSVARQPLNIRHLVSAPAERVAALQARYPAARVVPDGGRAGGIYGALNAGLDQAGGGWDWFTYINDDDLLLPGFGEAYRRPAGAGVRGRVLYGDVDLIDEDGSVLGRVTTERSPRWIAPLLLSGVSPLMQQGMLIDRETVGRLRAFDPRYRLCADLDFWLRAYAGGSRFLHHRRRVAQFRLRRGQLSGDTSRTEGEQAEIVRRHLGGRSPGWLRRIAVIKYRLCNAPRYLARARTRGWQTSYQLLQGGEARR